jgi:DNA-binding response OmpR family regulator
MAISRLPTRAASPLRALVICNDRPIPTIAGLTAHVPRMIEVDRAPAAAGVAHAARLQPHAVLVDGRLSSAIRVLKDLRGALPTLPVLFVAPTFNAVAPAIAAGATDFVMLDAAPTETLLRLRCLASAARRVPAQTRTVGSLRLDRDARSLSSGARTVSLTPIEFKMFERLLLQPGLPVSRAELERSIWRQDEVDELPTNIAVVYISYLRRKLARLRGCSIRTITNVGYVLDLG